MNSFKVSMFLKGFVASIFIVLGIFALSVAIFMLLFPSVMANEYSSKYDVIAVFLVSFFFLLMGIACLHERREDQIYEHKCMVESRSKVRSSRDGLNA